MKTMRTVLFTLMAVITAISVFVAVFQGSECDCPEPATHTTQAESERAPIADSATRSLLNVLRAIITLTVVFFLVLALWQVSRFLQAKRKRM